MKDLTLHLSLALALLAALAGSGCSEKEPEPIPAPSVDSASLEITINAVPPPFIVTRNEGPVLELVAPGETGDATLSIEATAETIGGINLVAEAESMQDWFEGQPDGQYFGNLELGTPLGPAFTARGSYLLDGVAVEELRLFTIHPTANRMLRMTYRYRPGEGKERLQQLAEVLGEVGPMDPSGQDDSPEASDS